MLADDEFRGAAADVDDQPATVLGQGVRRAKVDQTRFLATGDDLDAGASRASARSMNAWLLSALRRALVPTTRRLRGVMSSRKGAKRARQSRLASWRPRRAGRPRRRHRPAAPFLLCGQPPAAGHADSWRPAGGSCWSRGRWRRGVAALPVSSCRSGRRPVCP